MIASLSLTEHVQSMAKVLNPRGAEGHPTLLVRLRRNSRIQKVKLALEAGMKMQKEYDEKELFICAVSMENPSEADVQEAKEGAKKCHEEEIDWDKVEAWDDVNNCKLDPKKVCEARKTEIEYFRRMESVQKSSNQGVQRSDRQNADQSQMG